MESGGATVVNKAEIDTSAPFRSVKEAVMLFGERVLAGEVYANKLKEDGKNDEYGEVTILLTSELEETKQSLQKAREESVHMARYLSSLESELEQTKKELHQLKTRTYDKHVCDDRVLEINEGHKYETNVELVEQVKKETVEVQKKKCVTFANPKVARVIVPPPVLSPSEVVLQRHPSLKKKKKKQLLPFIGGFFSRKRGSCSHEVAMA